MKVVCSYTKESKILLHFTYIVINYAHMFTAKCFSINFQYKHIIEIVKSTLFLSGICHRRGDKIEKYLCI